MATSDVDLDGDLDLVTVAGLHLNQGSEGAWLQIRAIGNQSSNRAALGATIRVETDDGQTRIRHVNGGTGQGCQDSLYVHFGLGDASTVDAAEVSFPAGETVRFSGPFESNQRLWLYEDGRVEQGFAWPDVDP